MDKIGIDARFFGPKGKGLGRYSQKLIEKLEKIDGGNPKREYYILLKKENFECYQPKSENFKKVVADFDWYSFAEQFKFPKFLDKLDFDLVHFCHFNVPLFYRGKFVITIHDLILFHHPTVRNTTRGKLIYALKLLAYQMVIRSATKRAKLIIAVSEFTKNDLESELKHSRGKVITTHEGCDFDQIEARGNDDVILKKYGIMKPYLLYVGNAYPHKNLERLVEAFDKLKKEQPDLSLVLVGGKDYFYDRLRSFVKKENINNICFPGFVPDQELEALYRNSKLYIFPSLYEGFGLPPLEALAKGTPVISSDKTSMPEVLGDAVNYFDPNSIDSIKNAIMVALKSDRNQIYQQDLVERQLKKFSWQQMAKKTLKIYQTALHE